MDTFVFYAAMGATTLLGCTILGLIGLRGFTAWIDLKRAELASASPTPTPTVGQRIDVADLKERVRRLEAIAAGVDI